MPGLIPVKPLKGDEEDIRSRFGQRRGPLGEKIKTRRGWAEKKGETV